MVGSSIQNPPPLNYLTQTLKDSFDTLEAKIGQLFNPKLVFEFSEKSILGYFALNWLKSQSSEEIKGRRDLKVIRIRWSKNYIFDSLEAKTRQLW